MSRFKMLSHVIWCCKYHIVWVPMYRFRILKGPVAEELYKTIHVYCVVVTFITLIKSPSFQKAILITPTFRGFKACRLAPFEKCFNTLVFCSIALK